MAKELIKIDVEFLQERRVIVIQGLENPKGEKA
jgi:hypothetical protein